MPEDLSAVALEEKRLERVRKVPALQEIYL
mgnify:CR=1 FL=1